MESYRTLEVWRRAHATARATLLACDQAWHPRSRALFDQLRRAAISVEANVVEGYALGSVGYVTRHLRIALGSAAEAECVLRLAGEAGYLLPDVVKELEAGFGATMRALRGLLRSPESIAQPWPAEKPKKPLRTTHDALRTTHP